MVVIRWNRLGQQHGAVWEAGSSMLAFEFLKSSHGKTQRSIFGSWEMISLSLALCAGHTVTMLRYCESMS